MILLEKNVTNQNICYSAMFYSQTSVKLYESWAQTETGIVVSEDQKNLPTDNKQYK